jgi:hypothetical protein
MSNTNLPRISPRKPALLSGAHWAILIASVLALGAVLSRGALSRRASPGGESRGDVAAKASARR